MSKILGFPEEELKKFFSNYQTSFFRIENSQYISKELEDYRQGYLEKREKQRLGGLKGAENKKAKQKASHLGISISHALPRGDSWKNSP